MRHTISFVLTLAVILTAGSITAQEGAAAVEAVVPAETTGAAVSASSQATVADLKMFRLRSGGILWGTLESHDAQSLTVRRLDQGGLAKMPWSFLAPEEEQTLRLRFGYVDANVEELMTKADRITLRDGTQLIGLIEKRDDDYLYLRMRGDQRPVKKSLIAGPSMTIQVPALEIYTRDELYQAKQFELQARILAGGGTAAAAHLEMAQYCEGLYDFEHAVEHYEYARESDAAHEESVVVQGLRKARAKAAVQEQLDLLAEIDLWRARRRFDRSLEGLKSFQARFPNSPVLEEFNKTRKRVEKYQEIAVRDEVVRRWHYWTGRLAKKASREHENFEAVLAYLDDTMSSEVAKAVTEDLQRLAPGIRDDETRRLWEERTGGRFRQASYGHGTWLIGEDRALAEIKKEEPKTAVPKDSAEAERRRLEERITRYRKNLELARKSKSSGESELESPEDFWANWRSSNRSQWVLAYHIENSGDFHIEAARMSSCRECGGKGARSIIYSGGAIAGSKAGERLVECPTCRSIGIVRRVRYR